MTTIRQPKTRVGHTLNPNKHTSNRRISSKAQMSYTRTTSIRQISIVLLVAVALATTALIAAVAHSGAARPTFISPGGGCGGCVHGQLFGPDTQHDA